MTTRKLLCVLNWAKVIFWLKYSLCERKVKILQDDFVKSVRIIACFLL